MILLGEVGGTEEYKVIEAVKLGKITKPIIKDNLILNVDGTIGILMVDMWRALGYDEDEINEFIASGTLNAFFIVGRSIRFIGHV